MKVLEKRRPGASVFRLAEAETTAVKIQELAAGQGLFESKHLVLLRNAFGEKKSDESIVNILPALAASANIFIFSEAVLEKRMLDAFKKVAERVEECRPVPALAADRTAPSGFNFFALADALGARDRKNLWVLYQKALCAGAVPEELSGILFWQLKSMGIATHSLSAAAAGLSPYVFSKARRQSAAFSETELLRLTAKLVDLYHEAHRGSVNFELGLEHFLLTV